MEDDKKVNRGPRKTTKITYPIVRKIKAFLEKKLSAEAAAEEAGMPISTFYRYSKMELQDLYALARETQQEAMTPEQRANYDAQMERHKKFKAIMDELEEHRRQEQAQRELKRQELAREYLKGRAKHVRNVRAEMKAKEQMNRATEDLFVERETKCDLCKKTFMIEDKRVYAYKGTINGRVRYFCSRRCYLIGMKRKSVPGKKVKP